MTMPRKAYIDLWIDLLEQHMIERPFTGRQAYICILNAPLKKGAKKARQIVPKNTYSLVRKMTNTKRVIRVGQTRSRKTDFSDSGGDIALYDFV